MRWFIYVGGSVVAAFMLDCLLDVPVAVGGPILGLTAHYAAEPNPKRR